MTFESGSDVLRRLLDSLVAAVGTATQAMDLDVSVHVVCNDDAPGQVGAIAGIVGDYADSGTPPLRCDLTSGHGNVGYGAAQNIAIRNSSAEFHLVLNPDVVLDAHALLESVRFLDTEPGAAMVVPQGFDGAGRYACLAKRAPSVGVLLLRGLSVGPSPGLFGRRVGRYVYSGRLPAQVPEAIELASGCFMFCRTSALRAVGRLR